MTATPTNPKIYHITHVDNLGDIVKAGGLMSDARIIAVGGPPASIGMANIKTARLSQPVTCHPGDMVGDYVPFYYCPRSVMLYLIYMTNHPSLTYRGGQDPIVHLQADLHRAMDWADAAGVKWAFTPCNARAAYADFFKDRVELDRIPWDAVSNPDFRAGPVKEGKQAEFLLHGQFPWELVERIGVRNTAIQGQAAAATGGSRHRPPVGVERAWYY